MRIKLVLVFLAVSCASNVFAQANPALRQVDRIRLAEAFRLGDSIGNQLWKDWNKAPFAVLLVTPDVEFLLRHPKPSSEFKLLSHDPLLKSDVYYRKRVFDPNRLATFPAVQGSPISTIVMGQAENTTSASSTRWVITMLHEHFHQLQNSQPTYYTDVDALELSGGDQTGMWMLNYAFPYNQQTVGQQIETMGQALARALRAKTRSDFSRQLRRYIASREELQKVLSADDYRYFSFQVWQEGIARYTELRVAEFAARRYRPSRAFTRLPDYKTFGETAAEIKANILKQLDGVQLANSQRTAFYPIGAGEGLLLDKASPGWRSRYFAETFYVDKYFPEIK